MRFTSQPTDELTPDKAPAVLTRLQEKGRVTSAKIKEELAAVRGGIHDKTRARVEGTGAVQEKRELEPAQIKQLLTRLKANFDGNGREFPKLHPKVQWTDVKNALRASPNLLFGLKKMEETGGKVDVIAEDEGDFLFGDTSKESPAGRRNVVFDAEAEAYLHEHFPTERCDGNAVDMVNAWRVDFMDKQQYRALQQLIPLDAQSRSWLKTPADTRASNGALGGSRRGRGVYVYRYAPYSFYGYGGFRAALRVPKL